MDTAALASYDIEIDLGVPFQLLMDWTENDETTPISTVGYTGLAEIRYDVEDPSPLATMTVSFPDDGQIRIDLAVDAMPAVEDGTTALWDVLLTPPGAPIAPPVRLVGGTVRFVKGAAR